MFDEGVKQECTFLLVQNQSSWKNNGSAEKEGGWEPGGGKWGEMIYIWNPCH
jgi:hypothetical protein